MGEHLRGAAMAEPRRQSRSVIESAYTLEDRVSAEEVARDESAEVFGKTALVLRDDCGMRDGQSQRMAKQRDDREPVRERANHRRLGKRGNQCERRIAPLK